MAFNNLLFLISFFFISLYHVNTINVAEWKPSGYSLSWRNCGPSSDPVQLKSLTVSPDPIRVPGNLTIDGSVDITSQIPADVHASVVLERKVGPFFVKVPCVDKFGSCNYANVCEMWTEFCPKVAPQFGLPCQCPIPASVYSVSNENIFVNKHVPGELLGEYRVTADFGSNSGHISCIYIDLAIKN